MWVCSLIATEYNIRLIQSFKKAVKKGTEESGMNLHDVVHTVYPVNIGVILFSVNSAQLSRT